MNDQTTIVEHLNWLLDNLRDGLASNSCQVYYWRSVRRIVIDEGHLPDGEAIGTLRFRVRKNDPDFLLISAQDGAFEATVMDVSILLGLQQAEWEERDELGLRVIDADDAWLPLADLGYDSVLGGFFRLSYAKDTRKAKRRVSSVI